MTDMSAEDILANLSGTDPGLAQRLMNESLLPAAASPEQGVRARMGENVMGEVLMPNRGAGLGAMLAPPSSLLESLGLAMGGVGMRAPAAAPRTVAPAAPAAPRIYSDAAPVTTNMQGSPVRVSSQRSPASNSNDPFDVRSVDDVMAAAARHAKTVAAKGVMPEQEAFARIANEMWRRLNANRYITPELAARHLRVQRGNLKLVPVEHDPFSP